jgi:molecular chaperone GrpE
MQDNQNTVEAPDRGNRTDESRNPAEVQAQAPESAAVDTRAPEVMPGPAELLRKAELAAQEHHDAWLRAKAETENVRRRAQTEIANAQKYALEGFAGELLAVRDSLEAALAAEHTTIESMRSGVELTLKQLCGAFDKFSIKQVNPLGEKFDPHLHQSISMVEADADPNTVVEVLQKGYVLNDRVIRPAMVIIAKPRNPA